MSCGNVDCFNNGYCAECGSGDIVYESQLPMNNEGEYPIYEEAQALRNAGKP